jgi:serine/threonine-protein kinase
MHDGLTIELKAWHDFQWLHEIGRLFCVFDHLISGNICFGVDTGNQKVFVKYAGARTKMYAGQPQAAIDRLKSASERYQVLRHPNLSPLIGRVQPGQGLGLVFPWFDGFALAPLEIHLNSLLELPLISRFALFDGLMDFFVQASGNDFLLAGLANQHILIDFSLNRSVLSSVDHFLQMPACTPYPKLPGSPWYTPPEGYQPGAVLDESTNVYAIGALAFTFFGNNKSKNLNGWSAGKPLFETAKRAVSEKQEQRMQSTKSFQKQWRSIILSTPGL